MDVQFRRDGYGLYKFVQFVVDAPGAGRRSPYIGTIFREGYRFITAVRDLTAAEAAAKGVRPCRHAGTPRELRTSGGAA